MTRKDYILIAEALKAAMLPRLKHHTDDRSLVFNCGVESAAIRVCDTLARDNPRFDRERFLKACGVQS